LRRYYEVMREKKHRGGRPPLFVKVKGKRGLSRPGLVAALVGCLFLVMAPVWAWGIAPLFIKLPDKLNNVYVYEGKLTVFADRVTSRFYPRGQQVTTPLKITSHDVGVPSRSDSQVLVVDERVTVRDAVTGQVQEGLRPPTTYALNRRTCENVPGYLPGVNRTGFTIKLPMGAEKKLYPMWDDDLKKLIACTYVKEGRVDGNVSKNVRVYVYKLGGSIEKMAKPPTGLPASVTGKEAKAMTGNPNLPVSDGARIELEYYMKTDATLSVEPRTGTVVYVPKYSYVYYVKNAPGQTPPFQKLAEVEYARNTSSTKSDVDASAEYFPLLDLDQKWTPLSFLVLGALLVAGGVVRNRKATRRASLPV
jgi:Porin PorA